jgi:hypothetical protein
MRALLAGVVVLATAQPVLAQGVWSGLGRASVSAGIQPGAAGFVEATRVLDYLEPTEIAADLPARGLPFYDVSIAVRVAGGLGAAIGVSGVSRTGDASVTAAVPHPFFFAQPRAIKGEAFGLRRSETGLHMGLAYLAAMSERADVMILAGATRFRVRQDLVSDVTFSEAYPYDTASFSTATVVRRTESKFGYHVGVDLTWKFAPGWGVGGLVRWARAKVPFEVNGAEAGRVEAGGLQAGGGVRLVF